MMGPNRESGEIKKLVDLIETLPQKLEVIQEGEEKGI